MQIQFKSLTEEMNAICKELERFKKETSASANDVPVFEVFHKVSIHITDILFMQFLFIFIIFIILYIIIILLLFPIVRK